MDREKELLRLKKSELITLVLKYESSTEEQEQKYDQLNLEYASVKKELMIANETIAKKNSEIANLGSKAETNANHWHDSEAKIKKLEKDLEESYKLVLQEQDAKFNFKDKAEDWKHFAIFLLLVAIVAFSIFAYKTLFIL